MSNTKQRGILRLREIIWEITDVCHNNCSYCGSKDILLKSSNITPVEKEKKILRIAEEIAKYPPKKVDISGGDPLTVSLETHQKIIKLFKEKFIETAILINPLSIIKNDWVNSLSDKYDIVKLYDVVGISINTEKELQTYFDRHDFFYNLNAVFVTNFNVSNVFLIDSIKRAIKNHSIQNWQIQLTMFMKENDLALYNNKSGFKFFEGKIKELIKEKVPFVLADNVNPGPCGAGTQSCGIFYDGQVVPCLSMRSWRDNNNLKWKTDPQMNILKVVAELKKSNLEHIWEKGFHKYRFCEFNCCKNVTNIFINVIDLFEKELEGLQEIKFPPDDDEPIDLGEPDKLNPTKPIPYIPQQDFPQVDLYGVEVNPYPDPNMVLVYGINIEPTMAYAINEHPYPDINGTVRYDDISKLIKKGFSDAITKEDKDE